jgi:hypothetical protein
MNEGAGDAAYAAEAAAESAAEAKRRRQLAARTMPDVRALRQAQQHVLQGIWEARHFDGLLEDSWSRTAVTGLLQCTQQLVEQKQDVNSTSRTAEEAQRRQQQLQMRNVVCLCNAVCPAEAQRWLQCVKRSTKGGTSETCEGQRRRLEFCTQRATSRLLHSVMLPPDRKGDQLML